MNDGIRGKATYRAVVISVLERVVFCLDNSVYVLYAGQHISVPPH